MRRIPTSSHSLATGDEAGENDNYGSVLAAHPGSRRGGQLQTTGSQPIVSVTACPTYVLPEAPVPEQPETLTRPPDTRTPCGDLHAPTTGNARTEDSLCAPTSRIAAIPRIATNRPTANEIGRPDKLGGLIDEYHRNRGMNRHFETPQAL